MNYTGTQCFKTRSLVRWPKIIGDLNQNLWFVQTFYQEAFLGKLYYCLGVILGRGCDSANKFDQNLPKIKYFSACGRRKSCFFM